MAPRGLSVERFRALYDQRSEALLIFFTRRTFDADAAVDLWAETFAQAFAGRRRFRGKTDDEVTSWLYGIAYRQLALYVRRGRTEQRALRRLGVPRPETFDGELERLEELAGLSDLRSVVALALGDLPADQQEALRLRVIDELPYPEIAARLGVSQPTARARVSRALRALSHAVDLLSEPQEVPT
jgi:RNA polymerase sigma-70 factor (ECF subfamily)